jgi:hypothetical protein
MRYTCPLCGQPVSASLYQKITGIWQERQKALQKIREQRRKLLEQVADQRKKLMKQAAEFRKRKGQLIKNAVNMQTRRLESKIRILNRKQQEVKRVADEKIRNATKRAHRKAEKLAKARLSSFKKELHASVKEQLKKERERTAQSVQRKYQRLQRTFQSTLTQMRTKDQQLRRQARQIQELERQLERQTTPQLEGLLQEYKLAIELKKRFPEDVIRHTGKGGDVIHNVMRNGEQAGVIVYECKRVQHYSGRHVKQTAEAKEKRKADFAVLVTNAMKKNTQGFFVECGVLVVHYAGVLYLVEVLREQTVRIAEMKLGQSERTKAVKLTLEYLEGPEFSNSLDAIMQETITVYDELKDEVKKHLVSWKKRLASYEKIYEEASTVKTTTKALMSGEPEYKKLIETQSLPPLLELPELEKSVASSKGADKADIPEEAAKETRSSTNNDRERSFEQPGQGA